MQNKVGGLGLGACVAEGDLRLLGWPPEGLTSANAFAKGHVYEAFV